MREFKIGYESQNAEFVEIAPEVMPPVAFTPSIFPQRNIEVSYGTIDGVTYRKVVDCSTKAETYYKLIITVLMLMLGSIGCGDTPPNEDEFFAECYSEDVANRNIEYVQSGQAVCPNFDEVAANCELTENDYSTDIESCEVIASGRCAPGYAYQVIMRENAVNLAIISPDYDCVTNGFESYTN